MGLLSTVTVLSQPMPEKVVSSYGLGRGYIFWLYSPVLALYYDLLFNRCSGWSFFDRSYKGVSYGVCKHRFISRFS